MVAIIYVWLGYFNNIISGSAYPAFAGMRNASVPQVFPSASSTGFWGGIKNNADALYKKISDALDNISQGSK